MPDHQDIPIQSPEGEGLEGSRQELNENIIPASIELPGPNRLNVTQGNENTDIQSRIQPGQNNHSHVFVYFLWILGISCLCTYIYIDVRLLLTDHLLTRNLPPLQERGTFYYISRATHLFTYTFVAFSVIWALFKAQKKRSVLYFLLFLELLVFTGVVEQLWILEIFNNYPQFIVSFAAIFGIVLIKLLQEFPLHLTRHGIATALAGRRFGRRLVRPLSLLLNLKYCCLILLPLFFSIAWLVPGINFIIRIWIINGIAITVSFGYIFIQIKCSNRKQLQPLYWCLWGMLIHFLFSVYMIIFHSLNLGVLDNIGRILFTISLISIIILCLMTIYFTDLLDAALVLRKTFLYGIMLLILLAFFGSMEHYVIHYLAHWLHLKNTVISSIFAGLTGMLFHPVKEKLSHWIKQFEKNSVKNKPELDIDA